MVIARSLTLPISPPMTRQPESPGMGFDIDVDPIDHRWPRQLGKYAVPSWLSLHIQPLTPFLGDVQTHRPVIQFTGGIPAVESAVMFRTTHHRRPHDIPLRCFIPGHEVGHHRGCLEDNLLPCFERLAGRMLAIRQFGPEKRVRILRDPVGAPIPALPAAEGIRSLQPFRSLPPFGLRFAPC